jgi:hypothetical protein
VKPKHRRSPNKKELARFKALADLGYAPHAIGRHTGRDGKTVRKWLRSEVYETDADLAAMIEQVKARELDDLYLLGAKSRRRLHELLDSGESKMIETIACMDRSFQQRRLLEGTSTANMALLTKAIIEADRTHYRRAADTEAEPPTGGQSPT